MAGGVALNCVANGRVLRESAFNRVWIQPASSDSGGALGAALAECYSGSTRLDPTRVERVVRANDSMSGSLLGPEFGDDEITAYIETIGAVAVRDERSAIDRQIAELLAAGNIVGVHRGRMEYGPRALGNRSILGDPRSTEMQRDLNVRTKMRESFRPFAPAVLAEHASDYFDVVDESPYMLVVSDVALHQRLSSAANPDENGPLGFVERVNQIRSTIPAVTHVDHSARVQTVSCERHPDFHGLISAFHQLTGCAVVINTSFNVRGQPIVCTPQDAYECFMATGIDALVLGNHVLLKKDQPDTPQNRLDLTALDPD